MAAVGRPNGGFYPHRTIPCRPVACSRPVLPQSYLRSCQQRLHRPLEIGAPISMPLRPRREQLRAIVPGSAVRRQGLPSAVVLSSRARNTRFRRRVGSDLGSRSPPPCVTKTPASSADQSSRRARHSWLLPHQDRASGSTASPSSLAGDDRYNRERTPRPIEPSRSRRADGSPEQTVGSERQFGRWPATCGGPPSVRLDVRAPSSGRRSHRHRRERLGSNGTRRSFPVVLSSPAKETAKAVDLTRGSLMRKKANYAARRRDDLICAGRQGFW